MGSHMLMPGCVGVVVVFVCVCVCVFVWYFFDETVMLVLSCVPFKQDDGVGIICMVVTSLELYNE